MLHVGTAAMELAIALAVGCLLKGIACVRWHLVLPGRQSVAQEDGLVEHKTSEVKPISSQVPLTD